MICVCRVEARDCYLEEDSSTYESCVFGGTRGKGHALTEGRGSSDATEGATCSQVI